MDNEGHKIELKEMQVNFLNRIKPLNILYHCIFCFQEDLLINLVIEQMINDTDPGMGYPLIFLDFTHYDMTSIL